MPTHKQKKKTIPLIIVYSIIKITSVLFVYQQFDVRLIFYVFFIKHL